MRLTIINRIKALCGHLTVLAVTTGGLSIRECVGGLELSQLDSSRAKNLVRSS